MSDHGSCIPHHVELKIIVPNYMKTEHDHIHLKRGVNFQVVLKQNRTKINCMKRDMPVLIRDKEGNIVSNKEEVL
jgi:hypothetical protein